MHLNRTLPILAFAVGGIVAVSCTSESPDSADPVVATPVIVLESGVGGDGTPTTAWIEAIRNRHEDGLVDSIRVTKRSPDSAESDWFEHLESRYATWSSWIDSLSIPFGRVQLPDTITILAGNSGGEDAFTPSPSQIAFDLGRLHEIYGPVTSSGNSERLDRFYSHEVTHLLHKAWTNDNPVRIESPLETALWDCLVEGIGNYRSLSSKWVSNEGVLTTHAEGVLSELAPVFVDRIIALAHATDDEAEALMVGLSSGPFAKKWGALTTALWLAQEAKRDDRRLRVWVERGPRGVLLLAKQYLPADLGEEIGTIG